MPHLVFEGEMDLERIAGEIQCAVHRWGTAVLKTENVWRRSDGRALLVEGVVVEHSRAVHPVAMVATAHGTTGVRLWRQVEVERTPAVQRWLAVIAADLSRLGGGPLKTTNVGEEILAGLSLHPSGKETE
jgi:hypothetical protein